MSRIRSIHPGIYTDEAWASVSIAARWLAKGLCTEADDNGIFEWKPIQIKMRIFPADNVDVGDLLAELHEAGIVFQFHENEKHYGAIKNFKKFQRPRKPKAWFPFPERIQSFVGEDTVPQKSEPQEVKEERVPQKSEKSPQMEDGGGKREDGSSPPTPQGVGERVPIPDDWKPPLLDDLPPQARACGKAWSDASYQAHAEAFRNHWKAKRAKSSDWEAKWADRVVTLHGQVMRDEKQGNAPPSAASGKARTPQEWLAYCEDRVRFWTGKGKRDELAHWQEAVVAARANLSGADPPKLQAVN